MIKLRENQYLRGIAAAFPHTVPVLTGFLFLGLAYGMLMEANGYGPVWSLLMSAIAFGGSMQFVAITFLTTAFDPLTAFLLSLMVNARHLFYGLSMLDKYRGIKKGRFFLIFALCDETFSLVSSLNPPAGMAKKHFYLGITLLDYLYWVLGSFLGGWVGRLVTFNLEGLDFVLTALFVVLFMEQLKKSANRLPGLIGFGCSIIALGLFQSNNMVIPSMILILAVLLLIRRKSCT